MKKQLSILIIISIFTFYSCKTENPVVTETGYGKIIILSNVENGEIFVDGEFTKKYSTDTLELLAVKHLIKVRKNGYFSEEREISIRKDETIVENFILVNNNLDKIVLLEAFTNSGCDSCNLTNEIFQWLIDKCPQKLFIINYPTFYPNPNDPMNLEVREDVNQRMAYYNVLDIPSFVIDGTKIHSFDSFVYEQLKSETKLEITVIDSLIQGDGITIDVFIDVYDLDGIEFNNLVLRIALIENNVLFETPPGKNGQKEFKYILRGLIPDYKGISLSSIDKLGTAKFAEFKLLNPKWKKENLTVVAFVQNDLTREVLQVDTSRK